MTLFINVVVSPFVVCEHNKSYINFSAKSLRNWKILFYFVVELLIR